MITCGCPYLIWLDTFAFLWAKIGLDMLTRQESS